jgi:hypothetical protein
MIPRNRLSLSALGRSQQLTRPAASSLNILAPDHSSGLAPTEQCEFAPPRRSIGAGVFWAQQKREEKSNG